MKRVLSKIPEKDRQAYIRKEAVDRVYNKLSYKYKLLRGGKVES